MNRLIEILKKGKDVSPAALKKLFRRLCRETHPDTATGTHEAFIRLRGEYEEAIKILPSARADNRKTPSVELSREDARESVLENLYLYSMRLFGADGEATLLELIESAQFYRKDVRDLWHSYYLTFYRTREKWMDDGNIFYTHNLFILSVKQLFYYYSGSDRYKRLLTAYLGDLEKRLDKLDDTRSKVIRGLSDWLREEAELEKIFLF